MSLSEIQLLLIHFSANSLAPIQGTLFTASLADDPSPMYKALLYAWRDQIITSGGFINGCCLHGTVNLATASRCISEETEKENKHFRPTQSALTRIVQASEASRSNMLWRRWGCNFPIYSKCAVFSIYTALTLYMLAQWIDFSALPWTNHWLYYHQQWRRQLIEAFAKLSLSNPRARSNRSTGSNLWLPWNSLSKARLSRIVYSGLYNVYPLCLQQIST
jgi:hypothetical protein